MRPVNLIPPDQRRGGKAPARTGRLPLAVLGGALGVLLMVFMMVSTQNSIAERTAAVKTLEQREAEAAARANALRAFADFATIQETREATVSSLAMSRFDWERVLRELALVIPEGVTLQNFEASLGAAEDGGTGAPILKLTGCGVDTDALAAFIRALEDIDGVTQAGFTSSLDETETESEGGDPATGACSGPTFEAEATFDGVTVDATTQMPVFPVDPVDPDGEVADGVAEESDQDAAIDEAADAVEAASEIVPGVE